MFARFRLAAPALDERATGPTASRDEQKRLQSFTGKNVSQIRDALTNYRNRKTGYASDLQTALHALGPMMTQTPMSQQ